MGKKLNQKFLEFFFFLITIVVFLFIIWKYYNDFSITQFENNFWKQRTFVFEQKENFISSRPSIKNYSLKLVLKDQKWVLEKADGEQDHLLESHFILDTTSDGFLNIKTEDQESF